MSLELSSSPEELRKAFFALETRQDIAELLDVQDKQLIYYLYILPPHKQYTKFEIQKKSTSAARLISAPITPLRIIQRKLNQVLQVVYRPSAAVHGFVPDKGIVTNAKMHVDKKFVFNLDLQDFFPTINFGRVRGLFLARPYERNSEVATVLAQISTVNNQLPQGAPTSPVISNMICAKMDSQLLRVAQQFRSVYTRYADDITFSTNMQSFPRALGKLVNDFSGTYVEVGKVLQKVITENGFSINDDKVSLQSKGSRQEVTGLTVNEFCNTRRSFIKQIRAMLYAWEEYGEVKAEEVFYRHYDSKNRAPQKQKPSFRQVLAGKIDFLGQVRGRDDNYYCKFRKQLKRLAPEMVSGAPCVQDSPGPSRELHNQLCTALVDSTKFGDPNSFRGLFSHPDLRPWRNDVPDTTGCSPQERVDRVLDDLYVWTRSDEERAIILLLQVLIDQLHPNDQRHSELINLKERLEREL